MVALLPQAIAVLERHGELSLEASIREKLRSIIAATIDRMPRADRRGRKVRGRSSAKPGTLGGAAPHAAGLRGTDSSTSCLYEQGHRARQILFGNRKTKSALIRIQRSSIVDFRPLDSLSFDRTVLSSPMHTDSFRTRIVMQAVIAGRHVLRSSIVPAN
ncbi:MAG: hypothetical protein ACMG6H_01380 [Acidobacteriota bacterium]